MIQNLSNVKDGNFPGLNTESFRLIILLCVRIEMIENCIFCRIISGDEPGHIVYRDADVIGFFPKYMEVKGHTLIVPTKHFRDIFELPDDVGSAVMRLSKELGLHYREAIGSDGVNLMNASGKSSQQSVFHFHFHLLPRFEDDHLNTWPRLPGWTGDIAELKSLLELKSSKDT